MDIWIPILLSLVSCLCFVLAVGMCNLCNSCKEKDGDSCCRKLRLIFCPTKESQDEKAGLTKGKKQASKGYGTCTEDGRNVNSVQPSSASAQGTIPRTEGFYTSSLHPSSLPAQNGVARTSGSSRKSPHASAVPVNIVYPMTSVESSRLLYSSSLPEKFVEAAAAFSESAASSLPVKMCHPALSSSSIMATCFSSSPLIVRSGCSRQSTHTLATPIPKSPGSSSQSPSPSSWHVNDSGMKMFKTLPLSSSSSSSENLKDEATAGATKVLPRTPSPEQGDCCERLSIVPCYRSCPTLSRTFSSLFRPIRECFSQPITSSSSSEGSCAFAAAANATADNDSYPQCVQKRGLSKQYKAAGVRYNTENSYDEDDGCIQWTGKEDTQTGEKAEAAELLTSPSRPDRAEGSMKTPPASNASLVSSGALSDTSTYFTPHSLSQSSSYFSAQSSTPFSVAEGEFSEFV